MSKDITIRDGRMYGGWRQPVNVWSNHPGSIHNDETARSVGMRGGTIPGTVHLNLFAPLFIELWGQRWFEKGCLSMFYTYATTDREDVRAVVVLPPEGVKDPQVEAWVEMKDGKVVARGTASVGDCKEVSYLRSQKLRNAEPGDLRILAGLKAGDEAKPRDVLISLESVQQRREAAVDVLDWYTGDSPWGGPIVGPTGMYQAMMLEFERPDGKPREGVGFFGATEVRNVNGPIKVGVPYRASGKLVCVGVSERTEYWWYDSFLDEKDSGKRVADMRKMVRLMKAGSPYYRE